MIILIRYIYQKFTLVHSEAGNWDIDFSEDSGLDISFKVTIRQSPPIMLYDNTNSLGLSAINIAQNPVDFTSDNNLASDILLNLNAQTDRLSRLDFSSGDS